MIQSAAKKRNLYKNFLSIFFLGISSGLPISLILSTLKASLVESGFDIKTVGFFALVSIPYSAKIFLAPIIDSYKIPFLTKKLGHRRSWIVLSQILLAIFIFFLGASTIFNNLLLIASFAFLTAISSASQDIVIDGYRIELFNETDQGLASGFYIYGYRIGMLVSGAGALALASILQWNVVYYLMALMMFFAIIITLLIDETRLKYKKTYQDFASWFKKFVIVPLLDILQRRKNAYIILFFIFSFKLADAFAGNLILPFLLDVGYTKINIATVVKTFGLFAILFGVLCGGILVKKLKIFRALWIAVIVQMLSNLAFCYLAISEINIIALYFVIFVENFSGGIGDAVFVAYLSSLCNKRYAATQYALLFSFSSLARSFFSSTAGVYAQNFGWFNFFIFSSTLAIPAIIILFWLTIKR